MPQTFAEKILAKRAGLTKSEPGQIVEISPDVALSHDNSAPIHEIFRQMGGESVFDPKMHVITLDHAAPAPVDGNQQYVHVSAGFLHSCALTAGGEAHCWGSNIYGEVGDSSHVRRRAPTPVRGGLRFTSISAGGSSCHGHTCAIATDGTTYCWGKNYQRYINAYGVLAYTPQALAGDPGFASVTVGGMVVG